jgi:hypothetical protein
MPSLLGVDEKAIAKGHRYMTLVCDLVLFGNSTALHRTPEAAVNG